MIAWLLTWGLLLATVTLGVVVSFVLGVRYERQRQRQMMTDYISSMGAVWGKYPRNGETDDDFRLRVVRAIVEPHARRTESV